MAWYVRPYPSPGGYRGRRFLLEEKARDYAAMPFHRARQRHMECVRSRKTRSGVQYEGAGVYDTQAKRWLTSEELDELVRTRGPEASVEADVTPHVVLDGADEPA